jgi:hypothetical protein
MRTPRTIQNGCFLHQSHVVTIIRTSFETMLESWKTEDDESQDFLMDRNLHLKLSTGTETMAIGQNHIQQ